MSLLKQRIKAEFERLNKNIERLKGELKIKSEFLSTRQCPDHNGKWPRGRCLQCEVEQLTKKLHTARAQLVDIVSFESATLRNRIKTMEKVIEAADYLKAEFLEDWKLNRLSIDTKNAATAYENKRKTLTALEGKMNDLIERLLNLEWQPNTRNGETHMEWSAPCGCAYHPEPQPHVHQCFKHKQEME